MYSSSPGDLGISSTCHATSHLTVELPKVLVAVLLLAVGQLLADCHKVAVDLPLLVTRFFDVLSPRLGARSRPAVQVEDELLGELCDCARKDDDFLSPFVLLSALYECNPRMSPARHGTPRTSLPSAVGV